MSDPFNNNHSMDDSFNPFDSIRISQALDLNYVNNVNNIQTSNQPNLNNSNIFNHHHIINQSHLNQSTQQNNINSTTNTTNNNILQQINQIQQHNELIYNNNTNGLIVSNDIQMELKELLTSLETLAQESVQHIFFLSRVLQPHVTEELRFPLLSKMFSDVPQMIPNVTFQNFLSQYHQDPNNHAFKLFMDFKELSNLLGRISYLQLFHLTNNLLPPGTPQFQFQMFLKIHEYFNLVPVEKLKYFNSALEGDSSLNNTYFHVQKIIQLDSSIPIDIIHFIAGIVSLPINELLLFHQWFTQLSKKMLAVLLALLQLDSNSVLDIKRILATSFIPLQQTPPQLLNNSHQNNSNTNHQNNQHSNIKLYNSTNSNDINSNNQLNQLLQQNNNHQINNNNSNNNNNNNSSFNQSSSSLISSGFMPPLFNSSGLVPNDHLSSPISSPVQIHYDLPPSSPIQPQHHHQPQTPHTPTHSLHQHHQQHTIANTTTTTTTNNNTSTTSNSNLPPQTTQTNVNNTNQPNENLYYLKIARQPPSSTVYQRILKPFPSIMLCGPGVENENLSNYFVEASLLRNDNQTELTNCLDGNKISRISNGTFAPFKKLKILSTTQQQRTLFRLKFVLKRYIGNDFQSFPNAVVLSDPIEVFSHTIYLTDKQDVPLPPTIQEVIPNCGPPGSRVVVLGANFSKSEDLKVSFNGISVLAQFYEKGTILCNVPNDILQSTNNNRHLIVKVTNDGDQYSNESVSFTIL